MRSNKWVASRKNFEIWRFHNGGNSSLYTV